MKVLWLVSDAAGKDLVADLQWLKSKSGQDWLLMEITFPDDYPTRPFDMRLVSPRCR